MVRTASPATREALLPRSDAAEVEQSFGHTDDGPPREHMRRPNLQRSEQVYTRLATGGDDLRISDDEGIERGLLLTVLALET